MSCFDSQAKWRVMNTTSRHQARLTQNTFLPNRIILDDELSIMASILESENRDFFYYKESTRANTSHAESTNKRNISPIRDEEWEKKKESRIPLNTKHNTAWAVRARKEWVNERNDKTPVKHDKVPASCI